MVGKALDADPRAHRDLAEGHRRSGSACRGGRGVGRRRGTLRHGASLGRGASTGPAERLEWTQPTPSAVPSTPDADRLLRLERRSRAEGSGLVAADLIGCWRLEQVWGKGSREPSGISGAVLRTLAARLEITPGAAPGSLALANVVNLGGLELRFEGEGELRGRRPLLVFWFDRLQLRLAGRVLLQRPLQRPEPRRLPFFALIARSHPAPAGTTTGMADPGQPERLHGWLAARGRGGGLALWVDG